MTDLEIAHSVTPRPILDIASQLGIYPDELTLYGAHKAKISLQIMDRLRSTKLGRYILVTAINPTPLGEGKTTTSIGLAMGLSRHSPSSEK